MNSKSMATVTNAVVEDMIVLPFVTRCHFIIQCPEARIALKSCRIRNLFTMHRVYHLIQNTSEKVLYIMSKESTFKFPFRAINQYNKDE